MSIPAESPRPSKLSRNSLLFGIAGWSVWCLYFVVFAFLLSGVFGDDELAGFAVVLGGPLIASLLTLVFTTIGAVLGLKALRKRDPKRGLAFAALGINLICLCPFFLFLIAALAAEAPNLNPLEWIRGLVP